VKGKNIFDRKGGKSRTVQPLGDAATVIIVRRGKAEPFGLFLVRRQRRQAVNA
jgi:hypothetical protein